MVVEIVTNPYYLSTKNTRINVLEQVREFKKTLESYGVGHKVEELDDD